MSDADGRYFDDEDDPHPDELPRSDLPPLSFENCFVVVVALFDKPTIQRTGLRRKTRLAVHDFLSPSGAVWVKCPDVQQWEKDGKTPKRDAEGNPIYDSAGYTTLSPDEYEWL